MKILVAVFLALVATSAAGIDLRKPTRDSMPSYQQFEGKAWSYPYYASPERARKIRDGISFLSSCMSKAQIESTLGKPDYSQLSFGPKGPAEKWIGSVWMYYLAKRDSTTNLNDPTVEVFFDTNNNAHWIVVSNIDTGHELGGVKLTCAQPGT
jgi:hypothetical protein